MNKVHVSTAMPLSTNMHDEIEQWLTRRYGEHITEYHVDESLIGGIVIFDGEQVFDGSIKSKLKGLK